jgi:hypothetical protein
MAEDAKDTYPRIAREHWFALRRQFKKTVPQIPITHSYITSVLGQMTPDSARANVLAPLRAVGLLDPTNKPTQLALRWRDDSQYGDACKEILDKVYPQEIRDLYDDPGVDTVAVRSWFASHTGLGDSAAAKMSRFYMLLLEADPNNTAVSTPTKSPKVSTTSPKKPTQRTRPAANVPQAPEQNAVIGPPTTTPESDIVNLTRESNSSGLSLHIDIQIHISPEAKPEQIEQIFASMAKHLPLTK